MSSLREKAVVVAALLVIPACGGKGVVDGL